VPLTKTTGFVSLFLAALALACNGDNLSDPGTGSAGTGSIQIEIATTGSAVDPDGYTLEVDAGPALAVGVSTTLQSANLTQGNHSVRLSGLAPNCSVSGDNPRTVAVAQGEAIVVRFSIDCVATARPDRSRIAFWSVRDGVGDIYLMSPDGTGVINLTGNVGAGTGTWSPVWSPDGNRIAYQIDQNMDIGVINADGTGKRNLTSSVRVLLNESTKNEEHEPVWSPDGQRIAYWGDRTALAEPSNWDIYAVNVDGSGLANLTNSHGDDYSPAWSPDGLKIAYFNGCGVGVCLMNSDGSGQVSLTSTPATSKPSWSPDGRTIMFTSFSEIRLINPDGTGERTIVTDGRIISFEPAWSPDGSRIAFTTRDIEVVNLDGTGRRKVTHSTVIPGKPSWSPDGTRVAYAGWQSKPTGDDTDIYVADVATGHEINITNDPAPEGDPAWSPN
jgi:Tol biopolymer transport system component